ncbi:MAG: CbiX/SirB N-terminal domain-containing protein [Rubrivivax sp.]|jgi:sirohydrochlorin cobaltochelatase|nr:CbiX/SirB N-terminal domain-containing protein [Rubrivivax sp.]
MTPTGLILFAHGARDPRWARPFEAVAERVRAARPDVAVSLAFLEFMPPDLPAAGRELAGRGCRRIAVLPMFLGAGGHVRRDLPLLVERVRAENPGIRVDLHEAVGEIDAVVAAMAAAAAGLLGEPAP